MNGSNFFMCGLRGVLKWCKVRAHEITASVSTIDIRPTLTYKSTSAMGCVVKNNYNGLAYATCGK